MMFLTSSALFAAKEEAKILPVMTGRLLCMPGLARPRYDDEFHMVADRDIDESPKMRGLFRAHMFGCARIQAKVPVTIVGCKLRLGIMHTHLARATGQ